MTMLRPGARPGASRSRSRPTRSGTPICPTCDPGSSTIIVFTDLTTPATVSVSIPTRVLVDPCAIVLARPPSEDRHRHDMKAFGLLLGGNAIDELDREGQRIVGDTLLMLLNFDPENPCRFTLPPYNSDKGWDLLVDTRYEVPPAPGRLFFDAGTSYEMESQSLVLFRLEAKEED